VLAQLIPDTGIPRLHRRLNAEAAWDCQRNKNQHHDAAKVIAA